ncbi:sensor histidine kinase [Paenibacillus methanolicus]|uniref:histidine kinase n=1 Tax=Paenibacillus methanolicus TaxID=582686 RepID=A0A5S5CBJ7_9BACL|nr:sensor histidine kinase [Paenibacillus methanolicus]TYP76751.1 two-component system sensor histidine kinase YesM [Paenibacillus methanolicus]
MLRTITNLNASIRGKPIKLALKIPFLYFLVILLSVAFSYVVFNQISTNSAQNKINEASFQTLTSIQTNVEFMVENVNNYSKMIFSDENLQNLLRQGNVYANLPTQSKVSLYLYNLMQAVPMIDSVYIFDNSGNLFSVGTEQSPTFTRANVHDAQWYSQVVAQKGKYILKLNGSGAFTGNADQNFVSFIRLIRDLDDTSPLGVLVINIKGDAFVKVYSNLPNPTALPFAILDESNQIIAANATEDVPLALFQQMQASYDQLAKPTLRQTNAGFLPLKSGSQSYTVSYLSGGSSKWTFVSMTPHNVIRTINKSLVLLALVLLIINGAVFFVTSFMISRSIIQPIHRLLRSMSTAKSGRFQKVPATRNSYEFQQLFIGYNNMIEQIDQLLKRIIEEQHTLRKAELNTLQAQIKPHFLYNTLDSITSLALSGLNDQVCDLLEALGGYYRASVSKGRDIITVGEEVEMVRNYLKIQQARYRDIFEVEYDVDESCYSYSIPKLVLQPLVENSLYHGIRSKGTKGTIRIRARRAGGMLTIAVADDGIGMSEEKVAQIIRSERNGQSQSFGLWGTLERLRIFYDDRSHFRIDSEPGKGTAITLFIPVGEEA